MEWWLIYLLLGAVVGFFAGLLGIGGGLIIVPVLTLIFTAQDFPPDRVLHLVLGTTMATIIFTSASSLYTHNKHNAVDWGIFKYMTPGIVVGTLGGSFLAGALSSTILHIIFILFLFYTATNMLLKLNVKSNFPLRGGVASRLPGKYGLFAGGGLIGTMSSLVAIGGGTLSVPFLTLYNVKLQHAIGTAAAIGFPIAVTGTIGYVMNGLMQTQSLPEYSLGYVYLPAFGWVVFSSMLTTPLGAKMTHTIQPHFLKKIFIALLYLLVIVMIFKLTFLK